MIGAVHALGLASTTAIVIHGDHGFSLGRHEMVKYNLYEDATRVPLIIAVPGGRGRVVDDMVEASTSCRRSLTCGVRRLYTPPAAQQQHPGVAGALRAVGPADVSSSSSAAAAADSFLSRVVVGESHGSADALRPSAPPVSL